MRSLAGILLSPVGLAPVTASAAAFQEAVRTAAGRAGVVETLVTDGDPLEPARIVTLFASPGQPATRATLLFLHGKGGAACEFRKDAVRALRLGFNVLAPDLRGHPPSTGARVTYGIRETRDLLLLLDAARERFGVEPSRLGIDGCSYGALLAVQLAAARLPAALWLQSPFGDLRAMAVQYLHRATGLPRALLGGPVRLLLRRVARSERLDLSAADPVAAARRVTCPAVVVHGEADELVPIRFSPPLYEALAGEKEFWRVPGCGHCHHADEPQARLAEEYERRWSDFFLRQLA